MEERLAILIQCHKNAEQVNMLLNQLCHPCVEVFVHVDKKSDITDQLIKKTYIHILPDELRVDVQWAEFSQVQATLNLMMYAKKFGYFSHYWLISGQDYPIEPMDTIIKYLFENKNINFIQLWESKSYGGQENNLDKRTNIYFPKFVQGMKMSHRILKRLWNDFSGGYNKTYSIFKRKQLPGIKYYFGSSWICLNQVTAEWILKYLSMHPEFIEFYKHSNCPDESFFQTLVMNSPFKDKRKDYLHYISWPEGSNNPKILTVDDYDALIDSDKLMARKFDINTDSEILKRLSNE